MNIPEEAIAAGLNGALKRHIEWRQETAEQVFVNTSSLVEATARAAVEAAAPLIAEQVLRSAYWKLRGHASALRSTEVYRKASERREGTLGESPAYQRYRWLEATARGIEDGARDLAELLGVEEYDIEKPSGVSE